MKKSKEYISAVAAAAAFAVLILDAKTALKGAQDGIALCLQSVIPTLFPFIVLSLLLNRHLLGKKLSVLRPIGKLCGIPEGLESLLLLGFLGGYPVGAQSIAEAYTAGSLSKKTANRLLGFCSNAGPAFIFGITSCLFTNPYAVWWLWGIHILSALIVGFLLPGKDTEHVDIIPGHSLSLPKALEKAIKITAGICGWIIVFRVLIAFCVKWFLWLFPEAYQALFSGVLELTNGIYALLSVSDEGLRFVLCSAMLSFGGICVGMQTVNVTQSIGTGLYFPGKLMQAAASLILSGVLQMYIFKNEQAYHLPGIIYLLSTIFLLTVPFLINRKKVVALRKQLLYNERK